MHGNNDQTHGISRRIKTSNCRSIFGAADERCRKKSLRMSPVKEALSFKRFIYEPIFENFYSIALILFHAKMNFYNFREMFLTRLKAIMNYKRLSYRFWFVNLATNFILILIIGWPLYNIYEQYRGGSGIYCNDAVWDRYEVSEFEVTILSKIKELKRNEKLENDRVFARKFTIFQWFKK